MINKEEIQQEAFGLINCCLSEDKKNAEWIRFSVEYFNSEYSRVSSCETSLMKIVKKPKIEIGDIYMNQKGQFVHIIGTGIGISGEDVWNIQGRILNFLEGKNIFRYNYKGIGCLTYRLDLSKKYEITEVDDE